MQIVSIRGSFRKLTWNSGPKTAIYTDIVYFKNEPTTDRGSDQGQYSAHELSWKPISSVLYLQISHMNNGKITVCPNQNPGAGQM